MARTAFRKCKGRMTTSDPKTDSGHADSCCSEDGVLVHGLLLDEKKALIQRSV